MRSTRLFCLSFILAWSVSPTALVLASSALLGLAHSPGQSADEDALRMLVEKFFIAFQEKDLGVLVSLWSENSPHLPAFKQSFQQTFSASKIEVNRLTIRSITFESGKGKVQVSVDVRSVDAKTGKPDSEVGRRNRAFHFTREGEMWKIMQYLPSEQDLADVLALAKTDEEREKLLGAADELVTIELVQALLAHAQRSNEQGGYSRAFDISSWVLHIARELDYKVGAATAMRIAGVAQHRQGNFAKALEYGQDSLKLSEEIGNKSFVSNALNLIGNVYTDQADYTRALEDYQRGLEISEALGNKSYIARALNNIGNVHRRKGYLTGALEYYRRSLELWEQVGDGGVVASVLNNIGEVYHEQRDFAEAHHYYERSLKKKAELGSDLGPTQY